MTNMDDIIAPEQMSVLIEKEKALLEAIIDTGDYDLVYANVVSRVAAWFFILSGSKDFELVLGQAERLVDEIIAMMHTIRISNGL